MVAPDYYRNVRIKNINVDAETRNAVVNVNYDVAPQLDYDKAGRVVNSVAAMAGQQDAVQLRKEGSRWLIVNVQRYNR